MRAFVQGKPLERFYEPVSIIEWTGKQRKLVNFSPDLLNAWIKHASYAARVRMLELEGGVLSEIAANRLLTSMTLIRCHMEAGGMACLCNQELHKWLRSNDNTSLLEIIPATFLGTSMVRAQKKDGTLEDSLLLSEQDKIPIGRLISSLDDFISGGDPKGKAHGMYGLLCEFSHPNMRAMRDHIETKEDAQEGWHHTYNAESRLSTKHHTMVLHSLLTSMKAGHSVCEMLRKTIIVHEGGNAKLYPPNEEALKEIWDSLLAWPEGLEPQEITA